jgi:hypothetical protein
MTEEYAKLEGFNPENYEDEDFPGGVREPKKPILPVLPGDIALEIEKEYEFDLCICTNK